MEFGMLPISEQLLIILMRKVNVMFLMEDGCLMRVILSTTTIHALSLMKDLLVIAMEDCVDDLSPIKQQRNTKSKTRQWKRKRRRSTTSKQSPYNQGTQDLTWFGNVPTSTGRRGEIFIE